MGPLVFTEVMGDGRIEGVNQKCLTRFDGILSKRAEVVHMEKWRWVMIPIVILGMFVFILTIYSV